jgi:ABC-2 type transport system permease protein
MRKIGLILRHEIITALSRPGYLLFAFGLPLLGLIIFGIVTLVKSDGGDIASIPETKNSSELEIEGYVDHAGIIRTIPDDLPTGHLLPYADEALAAKALEEGEISAYYIVPEDYITSGEFIYVHPNSSPFSSGGKDWVMSWALLVNMLDGDMELASRIWNPMDLEVTNLDPIPEVDRFTQEDCSKPGRTCESNILVQMLPMFVVILFFVFTSISSGQLLANITKEKQNRMMEVLMLSVDPKEMMAGKVIGLGLVSLLQVAFWAVSMYTMIALGGNTLNLPAGFSIPISVLIWWILLFLLGYAITATLMGGIGALVPNPKVANQGSWIVLLPTFLGYFVAVTPVGQGDPHGLVSTVLSIFPLTAPVVMIMRVTIGGVPLWQLALTVVLMIVTAVFIVRAVARMFRAQTILSGQPFSARRYFLALAGRA